MNKERALSTIWGGAVADAIGNPLEFHAVVPDGLFEKSVSAPILRISDDTQMTLFNYEGLIEGLSPRQVLLNWYKTQITPCPTLKAEGLLEFNSLYRSEAPGATCMGSCARLSRKERVTNDSKGNGTVMRAAPFAVHAYLKGLAPESAYLLAKEDALATHKHPFAWQSSVLLVAIYLNLFKGMPLKTSVLQAIEDLPSCSEVGKVLMSVYDPFKWQDMRARRSGWVAEEALALAIGANHYHAGYLSVVKAACQGVSCDSDTVAGIAGGISAALGYEVPETLKRKVAADNAIRYIIDLYQ